MIHQRLAQGVMLLFLAGATFAACSSDPPSTPQGKYCDSLCTCNKCTDSELATCNDDMLNLEDEARGADCKSQYDTLLTCLNGDPTCVDGAYDTSICFNEETDLNVCIKPPPACSTVDNGICNEPAPAGNGTCATGTDKNDCMVAACPTANDGFCDEPEGSGLCPNGSDPLDCPAEMCVRCFSFAIDTTKTLCELSNTAFSAFYECACGACIDSCSNIGDLCDFGSVSQGCTSCVSALCPTQYDACIQDG